LTQGDFSFIICGYAREGCCTPGGVCNCDEPGDCSARR